MKERQREPGIHPDPPVFPFADCLAADTPRLAEMENALRRQTDAPLKAKYERLLARSRAAVAKRCENLPRPEFSGDLPVNALRAQIAAAIRENPVIIVCGETGSGKTTQLPKICLDLRRGTRGWIGHTQPRRIAARATALRVAKELNREDAVGYHIRFSDPTPANAYIKLMTDGILLAETGSDPRLLKYDTLIIDEAHERSLNIDFILGYLKRLLPDRPDLRLIITSATIDAARFAAHFSQNGKNAPIVEVSGRMYPVDVRYRPVGEENVPARREDAPPDNKRDLHDAIADACEELAQSGDGDILVFLPGANEIREAADTLSKRLKAPRGGLEILPLFSRLSMEEQARIFRPHLGRRIVLATNVAETSLTVPGIRYVVDTGLARIKRYSYRNKVEQLKIEKISRASANQRAGRCGRVAAGVCVRLYDEKDYLARPEFTDPEILRSSLAGVILRMKSSALGRVETFPFIDTPPSSAIHDGYQLLRELGAIDERQELTATGRELSRLPLDPRIARIIVAARQENCVDEILVIAAALSVPDPREPARDGKAFPTRADGQDETSEFLAWLTLWAWYAERREAMTRRQLLRECQANALSAVRLREWRDVHEQLRALCEERGFPMSGLPGGPSRARYESIHRALLAGLLGNIGRQVEETKPGFPSGARYQGARDIRFAVHPSSTLVKKAGQWIVAAEITETSRLFARCVARIQPEWIEAVGAHLVKTHVFDPHWEKNAMRAIAYERVTLYGLVVNPKKRIDFGRIDPLAARELFIRQGLVDGEITDDAARRWSFYAHNRQLIDEIEAIEHKSRRPDVLVDDALIAAFYEKNIPASVTCGAEFDRWFRQAERENPKLLRLEREALMRHEAAGVTTAAFPRALHLDGVDFALSYHFEPGSEKDGVTIDAPLELLNQIPERRCEWLIPGLIEEKVAQLVKTLPQKIRAKLGGVPEFAEKFVGWADETTRRDALIPAIIRFIRETSGIAERGWELTPDAFKPEMLPAHLFFNFRVIDKNARQLAMGRNLAPLRAEWGETARTEFSSLARAREKPSGLTGWTFGELPESTDVSGIRGYPGLVDDRDSVSLAIFDTAEAARCAHAGGLSRLFRLALKTQLQSIAKQLPNPGWLKMTEGLFDDIRAQWIEVAVRRACLSDPWPRDEKSFLDRVADAKPRLHLLAQEIARLTDETLGEWQAVRKKLAAAKAHADAVRDIEKQLAVLLGKRFVVETPFERLRHFPRYLKAVSLRLDKLLRDPARDKRLMAECQALALPCEREALSCARQGRHDERVEQFRWLLEELRVHLFAQELKTPAPISVKRLKALWDSF